MNLLHIIIAVVSLFVRNSCMAPMFSFESNKKVLDLTMSIQNRLLFFASNLSSSFANEEQKRVGCDVFEMALFMTFLLQTVGNEMAALYGRIFANFKRRLLTERRGEIELKTAVRTLKTIILCR